jgi:hypothetical protein
MDWREIGIFLAGGALTAIVFLIKGFGTNWINDYWTVRKTRQLQPLQLINDEINLYLLVDNLKGPKGYECYQISFQLKNESHRDVVIKSGQLGRYSLTSITPGNIAYRGNEYVFEGRLIPCYKKVHVICLYELQWGKYNDIPDVAELELNYDIEGIHCGPQRYSANIKIIR